jgi:phosphoribosylamine--glycine ligase
VFAVTGTGDTLEHARDASQRAVAQIHFGGMQWRKDIGWRELTRRA